MEKPTSKEFRQFKTKAINVLSQCNDLNNIIKSIKKNERKTSQKRIMKILHLRNSDNLRNFY